jgi:hypothetical protein
MGYDDERECYQAANGHFLTVATGCFLASKFESPKRTGFSERAGNGTAARGLPPIAGQRAICHQSIPKGS